MEGLEPRVCPLHASQHAKHQGPAQLTHTAAAVLRWQAKARLAGQARVGRLAVRAVGDAACHTLCRGVVPVEPLGARVAARRVLAAALAVGLLRAGAAAGRRRGLWEAGGRSASACAASMRERPSMPACPRTWHAVHSPVARSSPPSEQNVQVPASPSQLRGGTGQGGAGKRAVAARGCDGGTRLCLHGQPPSTGRTTSQPTHLVQLALHAAHAPSTTPHSGLQAVQVAVSPSHCQQLASAHFSHLSPTNPKPASHESGEHEPGAPSHEVQFAAHATQSPLASVAKA